MAPCLSRNEPALTAGTCRMNDSRARGSIALWIKKAPRPLNICAISVL